MHREWTPHRATCLRPRRENRDPSDNTARSFAQAKLEVFKDGGGLSGGETERWSADGTTGSSGALFLNRTNTFAVPFTFGIASELRVQLSTITTARTRFGADSISDLGHTLEWGGIVSVKDNSNNLVNNYTLTSGSGTNYIQPIPEPGAWALTAGGLLMFLGDRRVRHPAQKAT